MAKFAGIAVIARPISLSLSTPTSVLPRRSSSSGSPKPDHAPSSQSALFGL
jgi:hypothetical protein